MADKSKNTGTGGINIDDKVYTMDVGVPDESGGSQGQWSAGDVNVYQEPKDISKPTKVTFAKYLSDATMGKVNVPGEIPNAYLPPQDPKDFSINDESGYPSSPTAAQDAAAQDAANGNLDYYAPDVATSYSDSASKINGYLKRGKSGKAPPDGSELVDGNSLLKDAAVPKKKNLELKIPGLDAPINAPITVVEQSTPIKSYVSDVLMKNRFVSEQQFATYEFVDGKLGDPPTAKLNDSDPFSSGFSRASFDQTAAFPAPSQLKLGESLDSTAERSYNFRKLSKVGQILQLRATGEFIATENRNLDPNDPGNALPVSAWLPGAGQLGAGVPLPLDYLDVEGILRDIENTPANEDSDSKIFNASLISFNNKFEGVINSAFEKFSGFSAIGMIALVVTLVIAIVAAISFFGLLFSATSPGNFVRNVSKKEPGTNIRGLGTFYGYANGSSPDDIVSALSPTSNDNSKIFSFFGILPTNSNFAEATFFGALSFFGLDENYNPKKTLQSPGYYVTMCRSVVRSAVAVGLAFKELVDSLASGGFINSVDSIFETLGVLKNSRVFAAMNVFAQLGDGYASPSKDDMTLDLDAGKRISRIDAIPNYVFDQFKSRLKGEAVNESGTPPKMITKLAWAANRTPDAFLIPTKVLALATKKELGAGAIGLDHSSDPYARTKDIYKPMSSKDNYRISTEDREKIEKEFDSEYMPFYFHDLRTNEVVGFHAFLGSLSDAYSPKYESSEGFGRMDPVMIYKNTTRKISFDFYLAALDEKDFDYMWMKINKLTTMVYPQYTQGKRLGIAVSGQGNYIFTRPFTQQIGAAPMVRIRLGDLLKSNYSKFNLARIFGAGDDTTQMKSTTPISDSQIADALSKKFQSDNVEFLQPGDTVIVKQQNYFSADSKLLELNDFPKAFEFQISEITYGVTGQITYSGKFVTKDVVNPDVPTDVKNQIEGYKNYYNNTTPFDRLYFEIADIETAKFEIDPDEIADKFTKKTMDRLRKIHATSLQTQYNDNVAEFMDEKNNAITRSFRSAGGKGLAGFIDSLAFDWMDRITWEITPGRKAPKMCKITIGFSPIHDLQPGLGHDGYNTAPIYGVGPYGSYSDPVKPKGKD